MIQTLEAVFDGEVLHPDEPLALEPNTRVRIVVETLPEADAKPVSFLRAARSLPLNLTVASVGKSTQNLW